MIQRSFQPRRKLQSDSDSDSGLFVIKDKLEARESVWWKETHIPVGRQTSEAGRVEVSESKGGTAHIWPAARRHASLTSDCSGQQTWETLCLVREGKPGPAPPQRWWQIHRSWSGTQMTTMCTFTPKKQFPEATTWPSFNRSSQTLLGFSSWCWRKDCDLDLFFLSIILVCYWLVKQVDSGPF